MITFDNLRNPEYSRSLKNKRKKNCIWKRGNPLIQFLLSISARYWIRLFKDQRSTSSQHVKMKRQSKQSMGLVVLQMMQFSKSRSPLDATTSKDKWFNNFSHNWPKKSSHNEILTIQFHNGLAPEDSKRRFSQIWFANFNLRYPWLSDSRGVSSSKERTSLSYVKNQVSFRSLNDLSSLLFISTQAQAQGN